MSDIIFELKPGTKVSFIVTTNGETGQLKVLQNFINLVRNRVYKIPVNTIENYDNNNVIKVVGKLREVVDIRNVENGYAYILPIIQNAQIQDGMILGKFI